MDDGGDADVSVVDEEDVEMRSYEDVGKDDVEEDVERGVDESDVERA